MADIFELFKKIQKQPVPHVPITHIIAGLGNPGGDYAKTRHNAGFAALDYICDKYNVTCKKLKFRSLCTEVTLGCHRALLIKPQTYMNLSGEALRDAAEYYGIAPENIIVISDDINLAPGRMRIRKSGSDGGHNGLKNIIYQLESDAFVRIRLGVGASPETGEKLKDWVLSPMSAKESERLKKCVECVPEAVIMIMDEKTDDAMSRFNGVRFDADDEQ